MAAEGQLRGEAWHMPTSSGLLVGDVQQVPWPIVTMSRLLPFHAVKQGVQTYITGLATLLQTKVFPAYLQSKFWQKGAEDIWRSVGNQEQAVCPYNNTERKRNRAASFSSTERAASSHQSPGRSSMGPYTVLQ